MSHSLKGSVVLVTGGAGLIGSHIVDLLIEEGAREIRVLDNLIRGRMEHLPLLRNDLPIVFVHGDVRERDKVAGVVSGCDYVFHQVGFRMTLCAERPRECVDVLVGGTLNVFEAAVEAGVKKVVYASSASVYGAADVFPSDERHHPYNNRTIYGASKTMNEGIARSFHDMHGLPSVGLRYFKVYGPRMDVAGAHTEVFIRWLDCIDRDERPQLHGDGSASMDFVFVEDVARANLLAMKSDQVDDVYNVASGRDTTLLELWETMAGIAGAGHLTPEFHPARKVNSVPQRLADTTWARQELGFVALVPLDEGLKRLARWRRQAIAQTEVLVSRA